VRVDPKVMNGTATIACDETRDAPDDIKTFVANCAYHCRGEVLSMQATKEMR
jgi:hypothetical protein